MGCGALVDRVEGPIHRYMTSAPGCWALWGDLNAQLLSDPRAANYRQKCADAYAVQHPGSSNPHAIQSVAGHLISLYCTLELGSARVATEFLERVTRNKGHYHWLEPPSFQGVRTVVDAIEHRDCLDEAAPAWAADAWHAWQAHHPQIRRWYEELRPTSR